MTKRDSLKVAAYIAAAAERLSEAHTRFILAIAFTDDPHRKLALVTLNQKIEEAAQLARCLKEETQL